jgi:hypothetical protein
VAVALVKLVRLAVGMVLLLMAGTEGKELQHYLLVLLFCWLAAAAVALRDMVALRITAAVVVAAMVEFRVLRLLQIEAVAVGVLGIRQAATAALA